MKKVPFSRDLRFKTEINIYFFPSSSVVFSFASFYSVTAHTLEKIDHGGRNDDERRKNANDREKRVRACLAYGLCSRQIKLGGSLIKSGGAAIVRPSFARVSDLLYTKYATVINMSAHHGDPFPRT